MKPKCRPCRRPRAALTIIEGLLALAVVEVAVFAVSLALNAGCVGVKAADDAMQAVGLAETLVEEILALPYADPDGPSTPGPETGETDPASFDNADDYDGYADSSGPGVSADALAFSRTVTASYVTEFVTDLGSSIEGLTVTVTVLVDGQSWEVTRFVAEPAS